MFGIDALSERTSSLLLWSFVFAVLEAIFLIPAYVKLANFPLDAIIGAAGERNAAVDSLWKMIIFAVAPFNLIKGVACSILNLLLYKRLSRILHI